MKTIKLKNKFKVPGKIIKHYRRQIVFDALKVILFVVIICLIFFGFEVKKQILECDIKTGTCGVQTINYYNYKSYSQISPPNAIKEICIREIPSHSRFRFSRRRIIIAKLLGLEYNIGYIRADGYTCSYTIFTKNIRASKAEKAAKELNELFKTSKDKIRYEL